MQKDHEDTATYRFAVKEVYIAKDTNTTINANTNAYEGVRWSLR